MARTVLVTDSTASLPADEAADRGIVVVPIQVVIGATCYPEGVPGGATPQLVAQALKDFRPVSTSRPTPAAMLAAYHRAAEAGADRVVSVHLSGEMSGTYESAQLAAGASPVPVIPVDSRQIGPATGYAVLSAADVLDAGGTAEQAAEVARTRAAAATSLFYVDTLEFLRRGGRIGAASALLGSALAVKPLLQVRNGQIESLEKVRTASRALARLEDLAVAAAGEGPVDVGVSHLASEERARALLVRLAERLARQLEGREVRCHELGAALGAHVGPGMVGVTISPRPSPSTAR